MDMVLFTLLIIIIPVVAAKLIEYVIDIIFKVKGS